ncbi:malectin domain-containing carbohydrate-binding protein [Edaphobacter modestus]|uniref:malectin domain-containing carbohydrate-binding protein n=1 Tax=Edaphobacter modestus TaxID=388466 RepID=UPI003BF7DFBB
MTYTLPNLAVGTSYTLRLHFNEFYWKLAGQRVFNVTVNGTVVLPNFDIIAAAGAPETAIVEQFTVRPIRTATSRLRSRVQRLTNRRSLRWNSTANL